MGSGRRDDGAEKRGRGGVSARRHPNAGGPEKRLFLFSLSKEKGARALLTTEHSTYFSQNTLDRTWAPLGTTRAASPRGPPQEAATLAGATGRRAAAGWASR